MINGSFAPFYAPTPGVHEAAFPSSPEVIGIPVLPPASCLFRASSNWQAPVPLFQINRCACNLLFPYVTNAPTVGGAFDTGIAIANTSLDPGVSNGFFGTQQSGPVQMWFYNQKSQRRPRNPTSAAVN